MRESTLAERFSIAPSLTPRIPSEVIQSATAIALRPRQRLALGGDDEIVYVVTSGALILEALPRLAVRQVVDIFYEGDIVRARAIPSLPACALIAAGRADVARITASRLDSLANAHAFVRSWLDRMQTSQYARRLAHATTIGSLTGEERLASLLYELVLRIGEHGVDDSWTFDLPLSRTDMANYLSLNADTLSRIMSRLKHSGLLATTGRGRGYTPSLEALGRLSPIADTIRSLHAL